jgi:hypothetical protein
MTSSHPQVLGKKEACSKEIGKAYLERLANLIKSAAS